MLSAVLLIIIAGCMTSLNAKTSDTAALLSAAEKGDERKLKKLIDKGVNINATDADGRTALHIAVISRGNRTVSLLLAGNPELNIRDRVSGSTPLGYAVTDKNADAVRMLLDRKPDLEIGTSSTPLLFKAIESGDTAVFRMLVDAGMKLDTLVDNYAGTNSVNALMAAVRIGNPDIVKIILDKGADVNHPDGFGDPAIIWAIYYNKPDMAELLISECADINLNPEGINGTALLLAKSKGHHALSELIQSKGGHD